MVADILTQTGLVSNLGIGQESPLAAQVVETLAEGQAKAVCQGALGGRHGWLRCAGSARSLGPWTGPCPWTRTPRMSCQPPG